MIRLCIDKFKGHNSHVNHSGRVVFVRFGVSCSFRAFVLRTVIAVGGFLYSPLVVAWAR